MKSAQPQNLDAISCSQESSMDDHRNIRAFSSRFLDRVYAVPDPLDTEEQWQRARHADLARADRPSLLAERQRLHLRLLLDRRPHLWLLERASAIQKALRNAH
jgi:hypothetical protein